MLRLSRPLTEFEIEMAGIRDTPAGYLVVAEDGRHLVVQNSTIELVALHKDVLKTVPTAIAKRGEEQRQAVARAHAAAQAKSDEQLRVIDERQASATLINFDD